jgi:hypothetical protein
VVRLRIENSKTKEGRLLPLQRKLWEIIEARVKDRRVDPCVFHNDGQKIGDFRKAWKTACVAVGLTQIKELPDKRKIYIGSVPHDLRRCAARNLSRAGVPESVAMGITKHKTRSMYRRYRIVDEPDLIEATKALLSHLQRQPTKPVMAQLKQESK